MRIKSHNIYPMRQWTDEEAKAIIHKFEAAMEDIPELREGCLYFIGISIPTSENNENGKGLTRTAHFMTAHPHTAILVGTGMATVYPILLSEMAAYLSKIAIAPAIMQLSQEIDELNDQPVVMPMPDSEQKPS